VLQLAHQKVSDAKIATFCMEMMFYYHLRRGC
jgi:hypothetical protein